ncbi:MAG: hypothetical protein ACFFDF_19820 [Candidatus Odinarchaeota archaeon]
MVSLKSKIIGEKVMIFGCMLIISVYLFGVIGMLITPRIYFSDFWESTTEVMLVLVILFYIFKDYHADLTQIEKEKKESENPLKDKEEE